MLLLDGKLFLVLCSLLQIAVEVNRENARLYPCLLSQLLSQHNAIKEGFTFILRNGAQVQVKCKLPGSPRTQNSSHTSPSSSASAPNTLDVDLSEHDFEFVRCFLEGTDPYELLTPEVSLERVLTFIAENELGFVKDLLLMMQARLTLSQWIQATTFPQAQENKDYEAWALSIVGLVVLPEDTGSISLGEWLELARISKKHKLTQFNEILAQPVKVIFLFRFRFRFLLSFFFSFLTQKLSQRSRHQLLPKITQTKVVTERSTKLKAVKKLTRKQLSTLRSKRRRFFFFSFFFLFS